MTAATPSAQTVESAGLATFSGRRHAAVWSLIVLASLAGLLAILAIWINRQLLSDSASTQTDRLGGGPWQRG